MKRVLSVATVGGALVAAMVTTASPAAASCSDGGGTYDIVRMMVPSQVVCVGYDDCDAPICINP